jgi:hypothetical protein
MTDRSSPAVVLGSEIARLEIELAAALAACPRRQRFEIDPLRQRVERLKAEAALMLRKSIAHRRASLR